MPAKDTIQPPRDLDPESKKLWRVTQAALREQGTWKPSDRELLERYVRSVAMAALMRRSIALQAFIEGPRGEMLPNPAIQLERNAQKDAQLYAESLLLTPQKRRQHKIDADQSPEHDDLDALLN